MAVKFADVSAYQPSNLEYFKGLKDDGAEFCWVKLSEGTYYVSPAAGRQLRACKSVFGKVGVYHFWHGESASYFLAWLKQYAKYVGFKLSDVKVALDVESNDLPTYVTNGVNAFEHQLVDAGIKPANIWTYVPYSWIQEGRFNTGKLRYGFIWVANYIYNSVRADNAIKPNNPYNPGYNAWQFSGLGSQDWSYAYPKASETLESKPKTKSEHKPVHKPAKEPAKKNEDKKPAKPKTDNKKATWKTPVVKNNPLDNYVVCPAYYKTLVDKVGVYADFDLKHKLCTLPKNYVFYGEPVINKTYTRLLTRSGNYISGNHKYVKLG